MGLKSILVIGDYAPLMDTRAKILERSGYEVRVAASDDDAMKILEHSMFDLIIVGNDYKEKLHHIEQRVRERHPAAIVMKLQYDETRRSAYVDYHSQQVPAQMVDAVRLIFGKVRIAAIAAAAATAAGL